MDHTRKEEWVNLTFYLRIEGILKELSSYKSCYDDFIKEVESQNKSDYENYCNEIKNSNDSSTWIFDFCLKFARNLKSIKEMNGENAQKNCLCFNYWVFYEIWKKEENKMDNVYDRRIYSELYEIGKKINSESGGYYCACYFYGILDKWKKEKDLHDYFKNFKEIKEKVSSKNIECNLYLSYLQYMKKVYEEHENYCCIYGDPDCRRYFDCDYDKKPSILSSKLSCLNKDKVEHEGSDLYGGDASEDLLLDNTMIIKHGRCIPTKDDKGVPLGYKCVFPEYQRHTTEYKNGEKPSEHPDLWKHIHVIDLKTHEDVTNNIFNNMGVKNSNNLFQEDIVTLFAEVPPNVRNSYVENEEIACLLRKSNKPEKCKKLKEKREYKFLKEIIKSKGLLDEGNKSHERDPELTVGGNTAQDVDSNNPVNPSPLQVQVSASTVQESASEEQASASSVHVSDSSVPVITQPGKKGVSTVHVLAKPDERGESLVQENTKRAESINAHVENDDHVIVSESGIGLMQNKIFRIGTATILGVGALFLFFLYYKVNLNLDMKYTYFTPFGSWLNRRAFKKTKQNYDLQEGFRGELLKNTSQFDRAIPNRNRVRIYYHSQNCT
ncbi:variable surface protein [Plasmodium gonderi]|uniref:Variable surface protein n=1 Tax=Plasmodium gonderi TaxID=77519 RepID=A0A1Y1JP34_PLAGO|nr:variable surface protein [Plasmodium gonderi]GAW84346.1 variable surface protein [Plasmodium gonderi]